jgi:DNA-binding response OmpR family regulator
MTQPIPRILIADDDKDILDMMEFTFSDENFHLMFAHDGAEALEMAEKEKPDLILLDVKMPRMDGFEVCRAIKKISPAIVVIILSSLSMEHDLLSGFQGGADDYITKPFSVGNLKSRVKSWLLRKGIAVPQA